MKHLTPKLFIFISTFFLSAIAASTSINGPTGLITIPTAESLEYKEYSIGFDYLANGSKDELKYKLNLGTFENWELGVVNIGTKNKKTQEGMYLNIKYYLMSDASENPISIALGSENLSSKNKTNIYMIASKKIRTDTGLHFGFKATFEKKQVNPILLLGTNYFFNETIEILSDVNGEGTNYKANIGTRLFINEHANIQFYILNLFNPKETLYSIGFSISKFM